MPSVNSPIPNLNWQLTGLSWALLFLTTLSPPESWAMAKAPPTCIPPPSAPPTFTTPFPVRNILLPQIGTKAFMLPNGVRADLNIDMQTILNTSVTSSSVFSPTDPGSKAPCNTHLELRSAVTTFQMDVMESGVSFGFDPTGSLNTVTSITGEAKVRVGLIAMDFSIWQCKDTGCSSIAAATSNHTIVGGDIIFNVDFGKIKTGAEFIVNPVLSSAIRSIMTDAMKTILSSPRIPDLSWSAQVRSYNPATGVLVFDEGDQSHLAPNQTFVIYAPTDRSAEGVCNLFQVIAYIHTSEVNPVSSQALVDQILDPRGIQIGDVIMVRRAPLGPKATDGLPGPIQPEHLPENEGESRSVVRY